MQKEIIKINQNNNLINTKNNSLNTHTNNPNKVKK